MLNVEHINPFVAATMQALEVAAFLRPTRGNPFVKADQIAKGDISSVIGLAGKATGSVAVTFPASFAKKISANMVAEEVKELTDEVRDDVGEVANMIAGGAKATLAQQGNNFRIAIPSIIVGEGHTIEHKDEGPCLVVPFTLDGQTFWVEVSFMAGNGTK